MPPQKLIAHRCTHCSREFNRSEHLIRHERIHTNEKPYKCGLCSQAFSRRDLLRRHELKANHLRKASHRVVKAYPRIASANGSPYLENAINGVEGIHQAPGGQEMLTIPGDDVEERAWNDGLPGDVFMSAQNVTEALFDDSLELRDFSQDYLLPDLHTDNIDWPENCDHRLGTGAPSGTNALDVAIISSRASESPDSLSIFPQPKSRTLEYDSNHALREDVAPAKHADMTESCWTKLRIEISTINATYRLPAKETLSQFIRRYFDSFNRHQPFLHAPTWTPNGSPVALVLAVCANGALYSLERKIAFDLYKLAVDMTNPTDEGLHALQTGMLLTAFAAWSGTADDLRIAMQFHGRLTLMLRQEWVLAEHAGDMTTISWERWRSRESLKRITFCLFTLMNLMNIAYDIPSPLLLEVEHGVPANEDKWCAETEAEWVQVIQRVGSQAWPSIQDIVRRLEDGFLPVPANIGMFGCHLVISFLTQKIILFRRSNSMENAYSSERLQYFLHVLERWQLMWESEPESLLSPDDPRGPIAFNCTAMLRVAYIRLVSDYSSIRRSFTTSCSESHIAKIVGTVETPTRGPEPTKAALQACLALQIPTQLGFKIVARTSFWVWSVQHSLSYFECALMLSKWLQVVEVAQDLSDEERSVVGMLEKMLDRPNGELLADDPSKPLSVLVLLRWAELLNTEETTVWQVMPKMARVLRTYADGLLES